MHKRHLTIVALAFLMCAISIYFGVRIFNANENVHLGYLNEIDNIKHDDVELVPTLSFLAALITLPFLLAIGILEFLVIRKKPKRQIQNIAYGLLAVVFIILTIDIITLTDPVGFDFSRWGFVWICLGLFIIAGNLLSFAIYRFSPPQKQEEH